MRRMTAFAYTLCLFASLPHSTTLFCFRLSLPRAHFSAPCFSVPVCSLFLFSRLPSPSPCLHGEDGGSEAGVGGLGGGTLRETAAAMLVAGGRWRRADNVHLRRAAHMLEMPAEALEHARRVVEQPPDDVVLALRERVR